MKHSEQLNEIAKALSGLQSEIRDAEKDTQGYGYKYADLYQVLSLIRPLLAKFGLAFTQHVSNADDKVVIETMIMHSSGQWLSSEIAMPPTPNKNMSAAQSVGSAITYGRRYALTAIFGITQTAEDTDAAHERYDQKKSEPKPPVMQAFNPKLASLVQIINDDDKMGGHDYWANLEPKDKNDLWPLLDSEQKKWIKYVMGNPVKTDNKLPKRGVENTYV